ncbi:hypothetical protein [Archangium sp.]|uniref:hypothetical protein n=1 Tax=Archangium sp. TaxID=1872627 RepID=UPI00389A994C
MRRWCASRGREPGAIISLEQGWGLARAWYSDRLQPAWRRKPAAEVEAVFQSCGLSGPFWRLTTP